MELGIAGIGAARLIGQGGSGRVYLARQDHLDRDVAVKIVPAGGDPAVFRRFDREQRAMGRLSSVDGVLPVHEAGQTQDGDLFLITPFLSGGSLQEWIQQHGPLPWRTAVEIALHVAAALEGAHQLGVVHRDIKPGNILLDANNRPLLADFGIASLNAGHTATSTELTLTPAYAAPETFETNEGTTAADIYSLGATLWALIAGRAPFTDDGKPTPLQVLVGRVVKQPIGDLRSAAPSPICDVIERATAKDPGQRPARALDFAHQLRQARDSVQHPAYGGVPAPPPTVVSPAAQTASADATAPPPDVDRPSNGRWIAAAAGLAVLLGVAGWWLTRGDDGTETSAVAEGDVTTLEADEAAAPTATPVPAAAVDVDDEPAPTATAPPVPTATPAIGLDLPSTPLTAAVDWLLNDPEVSGAFDNVGAAPCGNSDFTVSHCYYGPVAVGSEASIVFASPAGTPEFSLRLESADGEWTVQERYPEPDPPNPFARPAWVNEVFATEEVAEVLADRRGFSDPVLPSIACEPSTTIENGRVAVSDGKTLNVRPAPVADSRVILELGPDFDVNVLSNVSTISDGRLWFMVQLPVPSYVPSRDLDLWQCGWAAAEFLDLSGADGLLVARCVGGTSLVFGGITADGRFEVAVCSSSSGRLEYYGVTLESGASIQLPACQTSTGRFRADNAGVRYIVDDNGTIGSSELIIRDLGSDSVIASEGFGSGTINRRTGLDQC